MTNKNAPKKKLNKFLDVLIYVFGVIAIIAVIVWPMLLIKDFIKISNETQQLRSEIHTETVPVLSVDLDSALSGKFIIGIGYANTEKYYLTYQIMEDGGKQLLKLPVDTIIYDTLPQNSIAYVEYDKDGYGTIIETRLYVPEGSLISEYDLSLD